MNYIQPLNVALITKAEAAKLLGRDPSKVTDLCEKKLLKTYHLPGRRRGMVESEEVLRLKRELELGAKFTPAHKLRPIEPAQPAESAKPAEQEQSRLETRAMKKRIADLTEDDFDLFDSQGRLDAVSCRAWGEFEKSRKLNIERLALEGQYVLASEVGPAFERAMLTINKGVLATPSRLKALQPDLSQSVLDTLDRLLREALEKAVDNSTNAN
jgi:hypothetical protein